MFSRKLVSVLAVVLSLVVILTTAGAAFAQEDADTAAQHPALAVAAPVVVSPGEPVRIVITELGSGDPVAGAEVWALQPSPVAALTSSVPPAGQPGWQSRLLGITDGDGAVTPAPVFGETGRFFIVATLSDYAPGLHHLGVKPRALAVRAPEKVVIGETVTIRVTDSGNGQPVAGAEVYARHYTIRSNTTMKKPVQQQGISSRNQLQARQTLRRASVSSRPIKPVLLSPNERAVSAGNRTEEGNYLGETDINGEVTASFDSPGMYQVAAKKDGYLPGTARITVRPENALNTLAIKGPPFAQLDEEVTFTVFEREDGSAVDGAEVYAVSLPLELSTADADKLFKSKLHALEDANTGLEEILKEYGQYLDTTDETGQITHAFAEAGRYLIIAVKDGYTPGVIRISVGSNTIRPVPQPKVGGNVTPDRQFRLKPHHPQAKPGAGGGIPKFRSSPKQTTPQL